MNKIGSRINGGNTQYKRHESDFYPTPREVTIALLDFLNLPNDTCVWEPACGENHMANVIRDFNLKCIATDLNMGVDFLNTDCPENVQWIITNPPFNLSQDFICKCLQNKRPFALLLKSQYWHAAKRYDLFKSNPPRYIPPLTWRPDFCQKKRGKGSPLMDVMWCIWYENSEKTEYIPLRKPQK